MIKMTGELKELVEYRKELLQMQEKVKTFYDYNISFSNLENELKILIDRIDSTSVLRLDFETGFYWLNSIYFIGDSNSDIMALIESYANETNCQLKFYELDELPSDLGDVYIEEHYLPINGGACYTDTVHKWDEKTVYDLLELL